MTKDKIDSLHKSISTPFVIEKDVDYYTSIQSKLLDLKKILIEYKADSKTVKSVDAFRKTLLAILRDYYRGNIVLAQLKMINQIKKICDEDLGAATDINHCRVFEGDTENIPFFRARLDADEDGFEAKDMGVIPFTLRTKCATERFSMPGLPCLYLGNTSYVCWLEMGKPADYRFNVSPVFVDRTQRVFDLSVCTSDMFRPDATGNITLADDINIGLIKRIMLVICSAYRVKESDRQFKSEYIIPQLVMLACQKKGLAGVVYISSKVSNSNIFGFCAINIALFSAYPNNMFRVRCEKSDLMDHMDIDDAFNYAMYKQFTEAEPLESPLWIDRCKRINNIESQGKQLDYRDTEFYGFDKFLVKRLLDKKKLQENSVY